MADFARQRQFVLDKPDIKIILTPMGDRPNTANAVYNLQVGFILSVKADLRLLRKILC